MKVTVLSECHLMGIYLIMKIRQRYPHTVVIRPRSARTNSEHQPPTPRQGKRLLRNAAAWVHAGFCRRLNKQMEEDLARELFGGRAGVTLPEHTEIPYSAVNRAEGVALLSSEEPDVLITAGAPILKPHVLELPSRACLNVHWGISPEYRGNHTIFQALRRRDFGRIGLTLHHIDPGIDTGPLIAHVYPSLNRHDTEATILAKCTVLGSGVLMEALRVLETGPLLGVTQRGSGVNYRLADRRLRHDLTLQVQQRLLRRQTPRSPVRIVRYFEPRSDGLGEKAAQASSG